MRLICLAAVLLSAVNLSCAEDAPASSAAAGLSEEEIAQGFVSLFDGRSLRGWQGALGGYSAKDGLLICEKDGGGFLFTKKEYADFIFRLDFKLAPGGNNGVGIRAPLEGRPARQGMEIQLLDDSDPRYEKLKPEQFCGSIYGAVAAKRGHTKPPGEWNSLEIAARDSHIKITLNAAVIVDVDLDTIGPKKIHNFELAGLHNKKGHLAFCGHHDHVEFRNLRIKEL